MLRTVDLPCSGCGAHQDKVLFCGHEHEYTNTTDETFAVVRCRACGLVRLNPRPAVSELAIIYPPEYYAYHLVQAPGGRPSPFAKLTEPPKRRLYQRRLMSIVDKLAPRSEAIRLLDVGCADGRLLDWYKDSAAGPRLITHGIDLSEEAVALARDRGHHAVAGRFEEDRELQAGTYDLIFASHVIEHVDDPRAFAQRAADLLVPGGLFVVSTPNFDSFDVRRFGAHWGGNHFPRHWTLFDARSIADLAGSVGLCCEQVDYEVNPVFWNWTAHSWLKDRYPEASWPDRVFPTVEIFHPSAQSFALLSAFTVVDTLLKRTTGKTASMIALLRKTRSRA